MLLEDLEAIRRQDTIIECDIEELRRLPSSTECALAQIARRRIPLDRAGETVGMAGRPIAGRLRTNMPVISGC